MKRLLAILPFCLVAASCQDSHVVLSNLLGPDPSRTPSRPAVSEPAPWTLHTAVTSITPHPCFRDLTGMTSHFPLSVERGEAMRLFVYWDPTDGIPYTGSLSGQEFTLSGSYNRGSSFSLGCAAGGLIEVFLTGRVSGRFSDDGRSISAEEVLSYLIVKTGEQVDVRYRWAATAPAG